MSLYSGGFIIAITCCRELFCAINNNWRHNHLFEGEKERERRGKSWNLKRRESVPIPSLRLNCLSLYPHSIKVNFIIKFSLIGPCHWRCLIAERKMTPILSENRNDVTVSPITALQPPYLPSPQTPSSAFFIRTSKPSKVIKIAPASRCRDQPHQRKMGCGRTDSLNVLIPLSHVYSLILIS